MRSHGNAIRGYEAATLHLDLEAIRAWVRSTFTRERMAEAGLIATTSAAAVYLGAVLYKGIRTYGMGSF